MRLIYPPFSVSFVESPSARSKSQTYARNCKANSIDLRSKISWANEELCLEIQANNDSITDSILSSLKVYIQKSPRRMISSRLHPPRLLMFFLSPTASAIPEEMARVKLQWKSTNNKEKTIILEIFQKDNLIGINTPLFNVRITSSPTQLCAPISTKLSSSSPKIEKSDSPIRSSVKFYVG